MAKERSSVSVRQLEKVTSKNRIQTIRGLFETLSKLEQWPEVSRIVIRPINSRRRPSRAQYELRATAYHLDRYGQRDGLCCTASHGGQFQDIIVLANDLDKLKDRLANEFEVKLKD